MNKPLYFMIRVKNIVTLRYCSSVARNLKGLLRSMPKEVKHTAALQQQRRKLKEKGQKYPPGVVSLKVLGSGSKGAPRSLYIFTDQARYLFNCGEGTQRMAHEYKMKLSKLEHIFITHGSWDNIGGLPGVSLTIQEVGVPEITIHGPSGTTEIFNATRRFVVLKDLAVKKADCSGVNKFKDNVMTVQYVSIERQDQNGNAQVLSESATGTVSSSDSKLEEVEDDVDYYAYERKKKLKFSEERDRKRFCRDPSSINDSKGDGAAMSYICKLHPRPGMLCIERCVEKNVPPGPLLGMLKNGENVQLPDGTTVKAADVRLPDDPGPVFIVIECPTVDYLDSLINNTSFASYQSTATEPEDMADLVVHFTPSSVMSDSRYKMWMERFPPSTKHLVLNAENSCLGSVATHRLQTKLNLIHPRLFPMLGDKSIKSVGSEAECLPDAGAVIEDSSSSGNCKEFGETICCFRGRTLDCVNLRPYTGWDSSGEPTLTPEIFMKEAYENEGFTEVLEDLKKKLAVVEPDLKLLPSDPQITFLGTGSSIPNKTRNTSGILMHICEEKYVLLDCAEGTHGQIVRFFGPEKSDEVMTKLRAIYVSHLHADHHLGLIGLLRGRREAIKRTGNSQKHDPLFLIAPAQIMSWLGIYHNFFEPILQEFIMVPNGGLEINEHFLKTEIHSLLLEALDMKAINTARVKHCPNAFGVAFIHKNNWKLTYSGDTMPTPKLVELGKNSDLLIHEATMEDDLADEAEIKLHSTTSQAIEVGKEMNAKFTLLTHFSQRYAKIPRINENFASNVGIAFDNMQVKPKQLPLLPLLYPALKILFSEDFDEMEFKTFKRLRRQELEKQSQAV